VDNGIFEYALNNYNVGYIESWNFLKKSEYINEYCPLSGEKCQKSKRMHNIVGEGGKK